MLKIWPLEEHTLARATGGRGHNQITEETERLGVVATSAVQPLADQGQSIVSSRPVWATFLDEASEKEKEKGRERKKSGMVPHTCNLNTQKTETSTSLQVQGQPALQSETLSYNKQAEAGRWFSGYKWVLFLQRTKV